jgi:hypothetical protein
MDLLNLEQLGSFETRGFQLPVTLHSLLEDWILNWEYT